MPSTIGEEPPENILNDFKVMNIGLYTAIGWAQPHLLALAKRAHSRPCFFLSGGAIYKDPLPMVFALSMQKAAQWNLMQSFRKILEDQVGLWLLSIRLLLCESFTSWAY